MGDIMGDPQKELREKLKAISNCLRERGTVEVLQIRDYNQSQNIVLPSIVMKTRKSWTKGNIGGSVNPHKPGNKKKKSKSKSDHKEEEKLVDYWDVPSFNNYDYVEDDYCGMFQNTL